MHSILGECRNNDSCNQLFEDKASLINVMSIETENKYLYIHINMPVLSQWNPTAAAKIFVDEIEHRHWNINTESEKTRSQPVFHGIFSEANVYENEYDDGDDIDDEADDFRNKIFELWIWTDFDLFSLKINHLNR